MSGALFVWLGAVCKTDILSVAYFDGLKVRRTRERIPQ